MVLVSHLHRAKGILKQPYCKYTLSNAIYALLAHMAPNVPVPGMWYKYIQQGKKTFLQTAFDLYQNPNEHHIYCTLFTR